MKIEIKGFGPKKLFNIAGFQGNLASTLQKSAAIVQADFLIATESWGALPQTKINSPDNYTKEITASGIPFKFVNFGTKVRYAHMSGDFLAKSSPGSLAAAGGKGGVAFINKKRPLPGIEARHFEKGIAEKRKDLLSSEIAKILPSLIK
jgi:hypothetical protein